MMKDGDGSRILEENSTGKGPGCFGVIRPESRTAMRQGSKKGDEGARYDKKKLQEIG